MQQFYDLYVAAGDEDYKYSTEEAPEYLPNNEFAISLETLTEGMVVHTRALEINAIIPGPCL